MIKNNEIVSTIIGTAGLIGVGYAICANTKLAKVSKRLDETIDKLAEDADVDISEDIIAKAVEKAVEIEAHKAADKAAKDTTRKIEADIHREVTNEVNSRYDDIKSVVLKEISASAAKIDVDRVRRDVEKEAKEVALKKFDVNLDDILEKFNDSLDNTTRIYASIREALTKDTNSGREIVVRLN